MKTLIITLCMAAAMAQGADWYWLSNGPTNGMPDGVTVINLQDRNGDRLDYAKTGLPFPSRLPALVDGASGEMALQPATVAAGKAAIRARQQADVTSETPKFFDAFTMSTNTMALIGTNRTGYAMLRYDGTKLTAAQREQYQTECIQYLAARLQLLERALRQKGVVNIKELVEQ